LFALDGTIPADLVVDARGTVTLPLAARSGNVWLITRERAAIPSTTATVTLAPLSKDGFVADFEVHGSARGVRELQLVVDGDIANAQRVQVDRAGRWRATVGTGGMIDPSIEHRVVAWADNAGATSPSHTFRVTPAWRVLADVTDPEGDDAGPQGRYAYPDDPGWRVPRPADIEHVRVLGAGGALRIEVHMHAVTAAWNPANGFDHVAFTAFLQLPGTDGGSRVLPLQNASLPGDMRWHYRLRAHGWSSALFSAAGASATNEGTPVTPSADIAVDAAHDTITFTLPATALGGIHSLSGAKLYLSTWDYDGGFRALAPNARSGSFGGGDGATDPLVMDDTGPITLD
jgi:hypothetical protein